MLSTAATSPLEALPVRDPSFRSVRGTLHRWLGLESGFRAQNGSNLRVRLCVRANRRKACPQLWKMLWMKGKVPVHSVTNGTPRLGHEASEYGLYQRFFRGVLNTPAVDDGVDE